MEAEKYSPKCYSEILARIWRVALINDIALAPLENLHAFSSNLVGKKTEDRQEPHFLRQLYESKCGSMPKTSHKLPNALEKSWESYGNIGLVGA